MVTRALQQDKNIHLMAINDPFIDLELMVSSELVPYFSRYLSYMLIRFGSVYCKQYELTSDPNVIKLFVSPRL